MHFPVVIEPQHNSALDISVTIEGYFFALTCSISCEISKTLNASPDMPITEKYICTYFTGILKSIKRANDGQRL